MFNNSLEFGFVGFLPLFFVMFSVFQIAIYTTAWLKQTGRTLGELRKRLHVCVLMCFLSFACLFYICGYKKIVITETASGFEYTESKYKNILTIILNNNVYHLPSEYERKEDYVIGNDKYIYFVEFLGKYKINKNNKTLLIEAATSKYFSGTFVGSYIIKKLINERKVVNEEIIKAEIIKKYNYNNSDDIWELYDLDFKMNKVKIN